jgi:hypothetical protein
MYKFSILFGFSLVVLMVVYGLFDYRCNDDAKKGKENIENSKKVKLQMSQNSVISIMGNPDTIIDQRFCYNTYDDSYPYIEFAFDSLRRVKNIYSPSK